MKNLNAAQKKHDRDEPIENSEWESTGARQRVAASDAEIEDWIKEFSETGIIHDIFFYEKNMKRTVYYDLAVQWVKDRAAMSFVAPAFWRWAKANCEM